MALVHREVEFAFHSLFKRCVECPNEQNLGCPPCSPIEVCVQYPKTCDSCASVKCIPQKGSNLSLPPPPPPKSQTNVGAIAGGTIAGVAVIIITVFIVWKYCLKGRRHEHVAESVYEGSLAPVAMLSEEKDNASTIKRDPRASTYTVASTASTVMTRASNVIQIAYIPGVTNLSGPDSPGMLVPPVPALPGGFGTPGSPSTPGTMGTQYSNAESHYFMPGDLRDSTYSGFSGFSRDSYARQSIAPSLARSSVATTIYGSNAIVSPVPAQQAMRIKAGVVSVQNVKGSPTLSDASYTPPVPQIDYSKIKNPSPLKIQMPGAPTGQVNMMNHPGRAGGIVVKPVGINIVKKGKSPAASTKSPAPSMRAASDAGLSTATYETDTESESDDHARARKSDLHISMGSAVTEIQDTPASGQGPFSDANKASTPDLTQGQSYAKLQPLMEEHETRSSSPFGDENAVKK